MKFGTTCLNFETEIIKPEADIARKKVLVKELCHLSHHYCSFDDF